MMTAAKQARFFKTMASSNMSQLFNVMPGVTFFAKNQSLELVCANLPFLQRLGFQSESQIIGKTDFELFPKALAEHYRSDDLEVLRTREPKLNIVELFVNPDGLPDWYLTNKLPVLDNQGNAIGVMGTSQHYSYDDNFTQPYSRLEPIVRYIQKHYRQHLCIAEIAHHFGLSTRQLDRRFQEVLKMCPHEFIMRLRIKAACEELRRTNHSILDIALSLGFYDQSCFTFHFHRRMGMTPLRYRKQERLSELQTAPKQNRARTPGKLRAHS